MNEISEEYKILTSQIRGNIIDWYPFKKGDSLIEVALEENLIPELDEKIDVIAKITSIENLEKFDNNNQVDYILLIGNISKMREKLNSILRLLKDDGKLLIITNNSMAIKNICLGESEFTKLYSMNQINELLKELSFNYKKYYYVLPDFETANVIFTDDYLPNSENITRNITFYDPNDVISNAENKLFKLLIKEDVTMFKKFANSFFIEASRKQFYDNNIKFVSFANMRKPEYRIKTIICENEVYKSESNKVAKNHIESIKKNIDMIKEINLNTIDSYDDKKIISQFQKNTSTFDEVIVSLIKEGNINEARNAMKQYYERLKEKLILVNEDNNVFEKYAIDYKKEEIDNLNFIKYGLWDLIFQNAFVINNEIYFYDQEWFEENIPVEFILYRAIKYCQEIREVEWLDDLYNKLNINKNNIQLFEKLDDTLQEKTRGDISWKIHSQAMTIEKMKMNYENKISELEKQKEQMNKDAVELLNAKDARIKFLEDNMDATCNMLKEKENEVAAIKNSTSWKITKPLRKIRGTKKGE